MLWRQFPNPRRIIFNTAFSVLVFALWFFGMIGIFFVIAKIIDAAAAGNFDIGDIFISALMLPRGVPGGTQRPSPAQHLLRHAAHSPQSAQEAARKYHPLRMHMH